MEIKESPIFFSTIFGRTPKHISRQIFDRIAWFLLESLKQFFQEFREGLLQEYRQDFSNDSLKNPLLKESSECWKNLWRFFLRNFGRNYENPRRSCWRNLQYNNCKNSWWSRNSRKITGRFSEEICEEIPGGIPGQTSWKILGGTRWVFREKLWKSSWRKKST